MATSARARTTKTVTKPKKTAPLIRESVMQQTNGGGTLERVEGFNVGRAVTEGFASGLVQQNGYVGLAPQINESAFPAEFSRPRFGEHLENVIGIDDRVRVPDTTFIPWRCICHLIVTFDDNRVAVGTGWFIGTRTIITAGHCVHDANTGVKAIDIQVVPGRSGATAPYGFHRTSQWQAAPGWPDKSKPELDYAAIFLPKPRVPPLPTDPARGDRLGYFGLEVLDEKGADHLLINNAGYPHETTKPFGTLWYNAGRINTLESNFLTYLIDTAGGQSGSPVFVYREEEKQRRVVAIHTTGYFPNRGIRITQPVFEQLTDWADNPP